jgi:hypothetical protein
MPIGPYGLGWAYGPTGQPVAGQQEIAAMNGNACPPMNVYAQQIQPCGYVRAPCRVWPCPFGTTTVAAGASAVIMAEPQYPFVGDLVEGHAIDDVAFGEVTDQIIVDDFRIGTRSQFIAGNTMNLVFLSPFTQNNIMNTDPSGPGLEMRWNVTNTNAAASRISLVVFGRALVN